MPIPQDILTRKVTYETVQMKGQQLPIVNNSATTGHKLEGSGVADLFVHTWYNQRNWHYVILSHLKTMKGLYIREPLKADPSLYAVDPKLTQMLQVFKDTKSPCIFIQKDYASIFDC